MVLVKRYVCTDCFHDYAIRDFINTHLQRRNCTYCGSESSRRISANLCEVLAFILDGVRSEWVASTPEIEWEAESLGWHGGRDGRLNSDAMMRSVLPELGTARGGLLQDIVGSMPSEWRPRRQYDPEPEHFLSYRWDEFAEAVKYHTRYTYYRVDLNWQRDISNRKRNSRFRIRPSHVIEEVLDRVSDLNVTQSIPLGTIVWRARSHSASRRLSTPDEFGPPSIEQALASSRMSPAGIPVFYGSLDRETAIAESSQAQKVDGVSESVAVRAWKTVRELRVLNLAEIPAMPSLFDAEMRRFRPAVSFLQSFSEEISRPIQKDGREHIEYVPTQVFTEYVRHVYRDQDGTIPNGVLYKSTVREGGINCVLFISKADYLNYLVLDSKST